MSLLQVQKEKESYIANDLAMGVLGTDRKTTSVPEEYTNEEGWDTKSEIRERGVMTLTSK